MSRCPKCDEYAWRTFSGPHECPPAWGVWLPERGEDRDDARKVYACDEESAATKWAERDDAHSADYAIVGGDDATVYVAPYYDNTASARVFVVRGESVPTYYASEVQS